MIDLHCHILPGVDDGPRDAGESLRMAEQAAEDGIRTIVATPHTLDGTHVNTCEDIAPVHARLQDLFRSRGIAIDLLLGAEARIHRDMHVFIRQGRIALLDKAGRYLLVEFPHNMVLPGTRQVLFHLLSHDITPILAHPERNQAIQRSPDLVAAFVDMGCLVQITAMSITGELGQAAMDAAHLMLEKRQAHVIATDAHDPVDRPPILSPAVEAASRLLGDAALARAMVSTHPRAIISGLPLSLPDPAPKPVKRGWLKKWFN